MSRHDHVTTRRRIRVLAVAVLVLQLGAAAALADTHLDAPPTAPIRTDALAGSPRPEVEVAAAALPVTPPATAVPPTTTPAPPTTVAAPAPALAPAPAAPPPAARPTVAPTAPTPPAPPADPAARVQAAYEGSVPAAWRGAIVVRFVLIEGNTSWAHPDGTIQIGSAHVNGSEARLRATVAHEFGHLIAFRYGSQAFNGAAPDGWPAYSGRPEEAWADCVSRAFTGVNDPSHGLPPCGGDSLEWTAGWVGAGPDAHARTGS